MTAHQKIGIISGGGQLPILLAQSCRSAERPFFMVALEGFADPEVLKPYPHDWSALGTVGRLTDLLQSNGCTHIVMAGKVSRPDFRALKLDWKGSKLLPKILKQMTHGDDSLFKVIVDQFEKDGFEVIGADMLLQHLLAPAGLLTATAPTEQNQADIARARTVVATIGELDIGQGAVICEDLVLAVEAAEGTDKMLERCAALPETVRGTPNNRRGVLLKMPKPDQERRVDLPTIGTQTIDGAAKAGLAGIAVAAGGSFIIDRDAVIERANNNGLFVIGF